MPVVSVYTIKGGVGKSTMIEILAIGLAAAKYKVLVIDTDLQADISYRLLGEAISTFSLFSKTNYGVGAVTLADKPPMPQKVIENLWVLPMEPDTIIKADERIITNLGFLDDKLREQYDFILIDTPPSYDFVVAQNIMKNSDFIFSVVTPSAPTIRTVNIELTKTLPALYSILKRPPYFLGIIRNLIHTSRFVTTDQINTMMDNLEKVCEQVNIPKYTPCLFSTMIPQRGSVFEYDRLRELLVSPQLRKKLQSLRYQLYVHNLVAEMVGRMNKS